MKNSDYHENSLSSDGLCEKEKNYGDPRISFIKTLFIVLLLAISAIFLRRDALDNLELSRHMIYYPAQTQFYLDFDTKNINPILKKHYEIFSNLSKRFSFGFWKIENSNLYNNLAVFEFDQGFNPDLLINKQQVIRYRNLPIFYLDNQHKYYSVYQNKLFISDSTEVLKNLIDRLLSKRLGLFEDRKLRSSIKNHPKNRSGTLFLINNKILDKDKLIKNPILKKGLSLLESSAHSVIIKPNEIVLNGKTSLDFGGLKNRSKKEQLKKFFAQSQKVYSAHNYVPESVFSLQLSSLKSCIELFLSLSNINQQPEYENILKFIENTTEVNLQKDLISKLDAPLKISLADKNNTMQLAVGIETNNKVEKTFMKLIDFLQIKSDKLDVYEVSLNNKQFQVIDTKKLPSKLYLGRINPDYLIISQQGLIQDLFEAEKLKSQENQLKTVHTNSLMSLYLKPSSIFLFSKKYLNGYIKSSDIEILSDISTVESSFSVDNNQIRSKIILTTGN